MNALLECDGRSLVRGGNVLQEAGRAWEEILAPEDWARELLVCPAQARSLNAYI